MRSVPASMAPIVISTSTTSCSVKFTEDGGKLIQKYSACIRKKTNSDLKHSFQYFHGAHRVEHSQDIMQWEKHRRHEAVELKCSCNVITIVTSIGCASPCSLIWHKMKHMFKLRREMRVCTQQTRTQACAHAQTHPHPTTHSHTVNERQVFSSVAFRPSLSLLACLVSFLTLLRICCPLNACGQVQRVKLAIM